MRKTSKFRSLAVVRVVVVLGEHGVRRLLAVAMINDSIRMRLHVVIGAVEKGSGAGFGRRAGFRA